MIPHGLVLETMHGPFILSNPSAIKRYKQFDPTHWGVPMPILTMEKITVWGRRWIVKKSKLKGMGLGLFACEDILVVPGSYVDLFPFLGTTYRETSWGILKPHIPHIREYGLTIKTNTQFNITAPRYVDGCPKRSSNIAGYINSNRGFESRRPKTNVQFHVRLGPPTGFYVTGRIPCALHVMTVAHTNINEGDEVLAGYDPSNGLVTH
jgi:hypothetical protein